MYPEIYNISHIQELTCTDFLKIFIFLQEENQRNTEIEVFCCDVFQFGKYLSNIRIMYMDVTLVFLLVIFYSYLKVYSERSQTSRMELFYENTLRLLAVTLLTKNFILNVELASESTFGIFCVGFGSEKTNQKQTTLLPSKFINCFDYLFQLLIH